MKGRQKSKRDTFIRVLAFLLLLCVGVTCVKLVRMNLTSSAPVYVTIPENLAQVDGYEAEVLTIQETVSGQAQAFNLYKRNQEENVPFQLTNMFPGDSKTQYYRVSVSYTGSVTVSFQAFAREGGEKLGEVLRAKVRLMNTDEILYEGMLDDMVQLDHVLTTDSEAQTEELYYEITVGLSTNVGNEYQNKSLTADMHWWAEGTQNPQEPPQADEDDATDDGGSTGEDRPSDVTGGSLVDPPKTGDESRIMTYLVCTIAILAVLSLMLMQRERQKVLWAVVPGEKKAEQDGCSGALGQGKSGKRWRRLMRGMFLVMLLVFGFALTTMALTYYKASVEENVFSTGSVSISLNDGVPVFNEDMLFEPGMVVQKDFTLRNDSSCDVYYRLYFSDIEGEFAESLEVAVTDGESAIFRGVLADMAGQTTDGAAGLLQEGEERKMTITFHFPENCGNDMQNQTVLFDLNADAVQAVNNPSQVFGE